MWELWITDEEREALKGSIENWEKRVAGTYYGPNGFMGCPLCILCAHGTSQAQCGECPVGVWVNNNGCHGTPYDKWIRNSTKANTKKELAFLKYLLKISKELK